MVYFDSKFSVSKISSNSKSDLSSEMTRTKIAVPPVQKVAVSAVQKMAVPFVEKVAVPAVPKMAVLTVAK